MKTLHLKIMPGTACAVCGADLNQPISPWWLSNCWTADKRHYKAQESNLPVDSVQPCSATERQGGKQHLDEESLK